MTTVQMLLVNAFPVYNSLSFQYRCTAIVKPTLFESFYLQVIAVIELHFFSLVLSCYNSSFPCNECMRWSGAEVPSILLLWQL